jgi:translation elongation factor EF-Tu-like GTPase
LKKVAQFKITGNFTITGRGLVAIGDLTEGRVKVGNTITFNTGIKDVTMKISGVEMGDKISTREYFVGLTLVYKNNEEMKAFENMKLPEQIVNIWETND